MKRALLIRYGAYGDMVIISPVIQKLKDDGYYIILNTGKRGEDLYRDDKRVDEIIRHDEQMSIDDLQDHWKQLKKDIPHTKFVNFTSSIENNVALHPIQPMYIYPKNERFKWCNRNYYEVTAEWAKVKCGFKPSLYFNETEERMAKELTANGKFNVLWGLSGSGSNKVYPWAEYVMGSVIKEFPDVHFITVGDEKCKILENVQHQLPKDRFTELSGETTMKQSMCLTKHVNMVVAPDTGILHASGCFDTPKIGLLGHTTKENITKHFVNDYSIESNAPCSPCFRLIYDIERQCPVEFVTGATWCMAEGIKPEILFERIKYVYNKHRKD